MKTTTIKNWLAVSAAVVMATTVFPVAADQPASAVRPEENYTGTVVSVDTKESTLETKGVLLRKKFNLGSACSYTLLDKGAATASDLRPGQKNHGQISGCGRSAGGGSCRTTGHAVRGQGHGD